MLARDLDQVPRGVEVVQTRDLFSESPELLRSALKGSDTLIHAAWYVEPGEYLTSPLNLGCLSGTLQLAQSFKEAGGRRFVGIGTCAEYDTDAGLLTTETPLAPTTLYAACKAAAFQALSRYLDDFAWCRLFYLHGEGERERRLVPYIRRQLELGEEVLLTSGEQVRDFLDVTEAGRLIADAALSNRQGPVNICSGKMQTVRSLAEQIADEYGRRDLLRFGARPENTFDPPLVVGVP